MIDPTVPITLDKTFYSGVLASNVIGKGKIKEENVVQTTHPNGLTVTRVHHNEIEVYDNKGIVSKHNVPNLIDKMA